MIGQALWQAIYISIIGGLLFLLFIPLSPYLFRLIGHAEHLRHLESEYFSALCYSALPTALVAVASSFFTGLGRTKTIILINMVGLLANVVLDYLLIFGNLGFPRLGVAGAGLATSLAAWAGALFGFALVMRQKHEAVYRIFSAWRLNFDLMKRYVKYGLPSGLQWALEGLAFTCFLIIVGHMENGEASLASSGIVVTVMMLAILPTMGIAQAVAVEVGQCLGDKNPDKAEAAAWSGMQIALMYIVTMGASFALFPHFYLNWFATEDQGPVWQNVSVMVPQLLLFVACFVSFDSMNLIFSFTLKGAGDTRFVSLIALLLPWPLMVLPTYLMQKWTGAIYWSWGAASIFITIQALIFTWRFRQGKWKSMSVIN
jgi:MATE family multidrug resistance protein